VITSTDFEFSDKTKLENKLDNSCVSRSLALLQPMNFDSSQSELRGQTSEDVLIVALRIGPA